MSCRNERDVFYLYGELTPLLQNTAYYLLYLYEELQRFWNFLLDSRKEYFYAIFTKLELSGTHSELELDEVYEAISTILLLLWLSMPEVSTLYA